VVADPEEEDMDQLQQIQVWFKLLNVPYRYVVERMHNC